jgi:asparagine N-glycosylation enzyme membrane subunit Stt3
MYRKGFFGLLLVVLLVTGSGFSAQGARFNATASPNVRSILNQSLVKGR